MNITTLWRRLRKVSSPAAAPAPARVLAHAPAPASEPPRQPAAGAPPDKQHRAERRDELGAALRETLLRAGILSSRYKARFLSLSRQAEQFVVLCELDDRDTETSHAALNKLERAMQRLLQERYPHLQITQIYWRVHTHETPPAPPPALPPDFEPTQPMSPHD
ncbi:MAG TPA: hypothetical protein VFY31_05440 [Macromonas sp.]|nr:hypothetical protein [Macromonas sp.]